MKKIWEFVKDRKEYIIILVVTLLVSIPLFKISLLCTGDTRLHLLRIIGLKNAIEYSRFPYIIAPFYCNNFGYATNLFYPQLVTYVPYILKFFTSSYEEAMKLFAVITIFLSGITMYKCTMEITRNKSVSLISSIIYITFPYRFENIYERYAIGEFAALIFIPVLFQGLYNLGKGDKSKHYLIAIGTAGMMLCHTITTLYAAIFCVIFILLSIRDFLKKDVIKLCFINLIFIVIITALFTVPIMEHKIASEYVVFNAERMNGTGADVYDNSASFKQLITDNRSDKTVSFIIGVPIILYLMISVFVYKEIKEDKNWYISFFVLGAISLFMVTKLFPWKIMPNILTMIQFSWRILVFFNFFVAPICAMNIYTVAKNMKSKKVVCLFLAFCACILVMFTGIRFYEYINEKAGDKEKYAIYEQDKIKNPVISHMSINREYLPEKVNYDYIATREDRVYILSGNCKIENEKKEALDMEFYLNNVEDETILEVPYIYYLGYDIRIDGNKISYTESKNGFIEIKVSKNGKVTIKYEGTVLEKYAYVVSLLGTVGIVCYIISYKRERK